MQQEKFISNMSIKLFLSTCLLICCLQLKSVHAQYKIPNPTIQAFTPSGLRVVLPDELGVQFVAFHGKINEPFRGTGKKTESGEIEIEVNKPTNGLWVAERTDVTLNVDDVLYYWIFVQNNALGYRLEGGRYEVKVLLNSDGDVEVDVTPAPDTDTNEPVCEPTVTTVNGVKSCRGKLIFQEDFSKSTLDTRKWILQQQIAQIPDFEFSSFQKSRSNSFISGGKLYFVPTLLRENDANYIESGTLDLSDGCTGRPGAEECIKIARSYSILPPVVSARISSNPYFNFRYGKVEIRAKLPKGDWIYPELFLVPKDHEYGPGYESGRMWVALAAGNADLRTNEGREINSRELRGGLLFAQSGPLKDVGVKTTVAPTLPWNNDFHTYTLTWKPDGITVSVDSQIYGVISPPPGGFAELGKKNNLRYADKWLSPMAPFDREYYLNIGLGVGGVSVFPDNTVSSGNAKPWRNKDPKALLFFWEGLTKWYATWKGNSSALQVDSIKVWAL